MLQIFIGGFQCEIGKSYNGALESEERQSPNEHTLINRVNHTEEKHCMHVKLNQHVNI